MRKQADWSKGVLRWGEICAVLGAGMTVIGLILRAATGNPGNLGKFITAGGLFIQFLGIASLAQYIYARRNPSAGRQMMINERDERMQSIRARAGYRAFWMSSGLTYALLMWVAFAGSVSLPKLTDDVLWFVLVGVVVVPFIVYIGQIVYLQSNH